VLCTHIDRLRGHVNGAQGPRRDSYHCVYDRQRNREILNFGLAPAVDTFFSHYGVLFVPIYLQILFIIMFWFSCSGGVRWGVSFG
jgi:hypothetical protein